MKSPLTCDRCGVLFFKENKEINRIIRLGRTVFYCSLSCFAHVVNSTPERKLLNSEIARRNFSPYLNDEVSLSKAKYNSERWKYVELEEYFTQRGVFYKFEFPMKNTDGTLRIFDLAFPFLWTLIEFDGPNHFRDRRYSETVDKNKNELAEFNGWNLLRIPVNPNSVIPRSVGVEILYYLF